MLKLKVKLLNITTMGYTNFYSFKRIAKNIENGAEKFAAASRAAKKCIEEKTYLVLAGGLGDGEPEFTDTTVWFNGPNKTEESAETLLIELDRCRSGFCKTNRCPYDLAVCITLLCFKHFFGKDFTFSSDGDIKNGEENWGKAKEIVKEYFS